MVLSSARIPHFATLHFESRLRRTLPTSGVFSCPLCRHEGKNFLNLSTHFLGKHTDYMKNWFREDLDKLEEAAFAKSENPESAFNGNKHAMSSGEEVDTSVRKFYLFSITFIICFLQQTVFKKLKDFNWNIFSASANLFYWQRKSANKFSFSSFFKLFQYTLI